MSYQTLCHTQIVTTTQTLVLQLVLSDSLSYTDCHYYSDTSPTACPIRLCHTQIVTTTQTLVLQLVLSDSLSYTDCHYYSDTSPTACPIRISVIHRLSLLLRHLSYQTLCHTQIVTTTQTLVLSDSLSYTDCHYYSDTCPIRISVIHRLSLLLRHLSYQTLCHTQIVTTTQTLVPQLVLSDSLSYTDCHYYSDTSPTACPIRLSVIHRLSLLLRH